MIRITQQDNANGAKRYYATADYYSEGQEIVGAWGGKGAERLGLAGTVAALVYLFGIRPEVIRYTPRRGGGRSSEGPYGPW